MPSRSQLLRALRLLLALAILGWVGHRLWREGQHSEFPAFTPTAPALVVAVGSAALAIALLALLYPLTLAAMGRYERRYLAFHLRTWLQAFFYRYVPGKVMLMVERARLAERAGVPRATSVVLVLWETLLLLVGAALVALAGLPLLPQGPAVPTGLLALAAATCVGLLLALPALSRALSRRLPALRQGGADVLPRVRPARLVGLVLGYAAAWLLLGTSFAATCHLFEGGEQVGAAVVVLYVLAHAAGTLLSVTPAGLGVREAVLVAGLAPFLPAPQALAMALAGRVVSTAVELVLVGAAVALVPLPPPPPPAPPGGPLSEGPGQG